MLQLLQLQHTTRLLAEGWTETDKNNGQGAGQGVPLQSQRRRLWTCERAKNNSTGGSWAKTYAKLNYVNAEKFCIVPTQTRELRSSSCKPHITTQHKDTQHVRELHSYAVPTQT